MLIEIAKPITLLLSILSLSAVFHEAFLALGTRFEDRLWDSLTLLALAAAISLLGGLIFREESLHPGQQQGREAATPQPAIPLTATLPVRLFLWTTLAMALLFLAAWYLETHCIFYRNVQG